MEHIPSPEFGSTRFGENFEDITAGLCRPLYCRNAHRLQGMHASNKTFVEIVKDCIKKKIVL